MLASGVLKPGEKLPPERELSQLLGVGRSALREALRSLEIAGIVRLQTGGKGGAFIRQGDSGPMRETIEDLLVLGTVTVESLTEARQHILDQIILLACERASEDELEALDDVVDRTEEYTRAGRYLDRIECSREFFRLLAKSTHNPMLSIVGDSLNEVLMRFVYARVAAGGKPQPRLVDKRRTFMAALRERNSTLARALMRTHLQSVHRLLLETPAAVNARAAAAPAEHRKATARRDR
jgi:GntR family transcriptional repressor for pyruvate dehydrogenase complex